MYDSFMPKTAALTDNAKKEIAQLLEDYATGVEFTQSAINSYVEEGRGDNFIKDLDLSVSSVFGQKIVLVALSPNKRLEFYRKRRAVCW